MKLQINGFTVTIEITKPVEDRAFYLAYTNIPLKDSGYPVYFSGAGKTRVRAVYALYSVLRAVRTTARCLNPDDDGTADRIHELCLELINVASMDTPEPSPANQDETAHTIG